MIDKKFFDEINELTNHLGLTLKITPKEFFKTKTKLHFISKATSKDKSEVIFRCALAKEFNVSVDREILLYQTAKKKKLDFFPDLVNFGKVSNFKWLIYKYIDGQPSGDTYRFNINKKSDFNLILLPLEKLNLFNFLADSKLINKCGKQTWPNLIEMIINKDKNLLSDHIIKSAVSKVQKNKFYPSQLSYVHGDYHPQNIFIKNNKIKIIDWESSHFNSFAFDYSFVWIRSYNEEVREKIWQHLIQKYPTKIKEIYYVFLVNLLRDYFEWNEAINKKNELLSVGKINNKIVNNIMIDLYRKIEFFSNKLI